MLGFDDGAHATALGKALLATMRPEERQRYVREAGMRIYTRATLDSPEALEADLPIGERRGMQLELGQYPRWCRLCQHDRCRPIEIRNAGWCSRSRRRSTR